MNKQFKILDLYCCAGGASLGYEQAGFYVLGVDIEKQKNYRGDFIQSDAIEFLEKNWKDFDAIHASPPCQMYSKSSMQFRNKGKEYADLIAPTRGAILKTGLPYIMENVPDAPLLDPIVLCGAMFGMRTYRHRLFESNIPLVAPEHPKHIARSAKMGRRAKEDEFIQYVGHFPGVPEVREMTGLFWLNQGELAQSIPPQYTKFLGGQLLKYLCDAAEA